MAIDYTSHLPVPLRTERFVAAGLTPEEAAYAADYQGALALPGLERARLLYMRGYDCDQIAKNYPQYTRRMLLAARGTFEWDKMRIQEAQEAARAQMVRSGVAQPTGLKFMNGIIESVNQRYEKAMMDYLTDPENAPYPEVTKADFERIQNAIEITRDILGLDDKAKKQAGSAGGNPLVSISIKAAAHTIEVSSSDQDDVIEMLREEVAKGKK